MRIKASQKVRNFSHALLFFGLVTLSFSSNGCSKKKELEPQSVRGKVFIDGSPAHKMRVTIHPVTHAGKVESLTSKVDEKGIFTFIPGVPIGDYKLSISPNKKPNKPEAPGTSIPTQYESPETSGLNIRIVAGNNDLEPINITK